VLKNGMTYEQFLAKICDLYGINKVFALAIVYEESGIMSSSLFNYSNNMGGLRGNGGWLSFPSLEAGTISYVFTLKNLLDRYNVDSFNKNSIYYFHQTKHSMNKSHQIYLNLVLLFPNF
jgi:hypothetical protein